MDSVATFNRNIAKIESLQISFYERDVIRSAYYNHLNKIPIPREAIQILKKHGITFKYNEVILKDNAIETRKKQYKMSIKKKKHHTTLHTENDKNIYTRNLLKPSEANNIQSQTILQLLSKAKAIYNDSKTLLIQCREVLDICFTPNELSYSMIANIIIKTENNTTKSIQAMNDFLNPFLELFDRLHAKAQQEVLQQSSKFLQKLQGEKDISAELCIKLFAIRAKHTLKQEDNFIDYLKTTINKLDGYLDS